MAKNYNDHRRDAVIDIANKAVNFTGGLEFSDLTYTVTKKKKVEGKWESQEVDLLHEIRGYAPKGSITAVMGPSGAGKSTLLDGLAGRIASGSLMGRVCLDGVVMNPSMIKRTSAYIMQEDRLFPMLTVFETLMFAADFRLGSISRTDKKHRVEKLIEQLGLTSARNTFIGDEGSRGVSGGERRRVSIGVDIIHVVPSSPTALPRRGSRDGVARGGNKRLHLHASKDNASDFDRSVRSPYNNNSTSRSWAASHSGVVEKLKFTPPRPKNTAHQKAAGNPMSSSPGYYAYSSEILPGTPTPHSSDYTVNENDYMTPGVLDSSIINYGPKFSNSFFPETWTLIRRNFINIRRTPELFLSRLVVLTVMGFMMATMFKDPPKTLQGITNRISFFIFTVCLFFFSSNDAVPAFIQERFVFVRETSYNAYRASSYTIAGLITYLPFLALQALVYALIVWFALKLDGPFLYFYIVLYVALLSTNSFVVFVSSIVPNYILGYAAVIAFTALFFLFCGYFLNSHDIPVYWKWMNKISTMTYPYEGLLMNQYQNTVVFGINPSDGTPVNGQSILKSLGIDSDLGSNKKWENVVIMLGWAVLYRVLFYLVLRFASKNQRT
ncbi:hypothetical protein CsatB_024026 [Cannabis sativa]